MKSLAIYFLFLSIMYEDNGVGADRCSPCSCHRCPTVLHLPEHIQCVDCKVKNLVSVPSFPRNFTKNIGYLKLDSNHIKTLENGMFTGYSSLQWLSLRNNGITDISGIDFNGLDTLDILDIRHNQITNISEGSFKGLQSLTELLIHNNEITNISKGAFNGLQNLSKLHLEYNNITSISEGVFKGLQSLTELLIHNNKITYVSKAAFNGLQNLSKLHLQYNKITNISEDVFKGLKGLTELLIHNNEINNILEGAFNDLQNLSKLHLHSNRITNISEGVFKGLQSLTELFLYRNKITTISEGVFKGLQNLTKLSLYTNKITTIPEGVFEGLRSLMELYLCYNKITYVSEGAFSGLRCLSKLHLHNNRITHISEGVFKGLQSLTKLLLHKNKITTISEGVFKGLQNLTELYLSSNKITYVSEGAFTGLQCLSKLHLHTNRITNIREGVFKGLQSLTELPLYNNKITTISEGVFKDLQSLTELSLSANKITNISEDAFNYLQSLKKLSLKNNGISNLPKGMFNELHNLTELYLYNNKITNLPEGVFNGLQNLAELDLHGNKIAVIPGGTFMVLQKLHKLKLGNNRISDIYEIAISGLTKVKTLDLSQNRIELLPKDMFKDMLSLSALHLNRNNISYIHQKLFLPLGNLFRLHLEHNNFKNVPSAFWTTRLSRVSVYLDNNPFICSCELLNDLKQLRHIVKSVQPSTSYYEERCTNITSVCEEVRNFALAMRSFHSCSGESKDALPVMEQLESEFAATDANLTTYRSCKDTYKCLFSLRVDLPCLPGVIVVTKVVIVLSSFYTLVGTIDIAVGDKLSNTYEPCNSFRLTLPKLPDMITIHGACIATPSGRDVRVVMSFTSLFGGKYISISVHEIKVNGYEKNKYNLWSEWNQWGPCSTTCGNGLRQRNRTCTNTTSLSCVLPGKTYQRSHGDYGRESCHLEPCFQAVYQWTIGSVGAVFALTVFGIVFWYRKFKMIRYLEGLQPNPNFELDPNKTLLEQIEELPYDLHWEFPRYDIRFKSVIGEGHFGRVWLAKAKGIRAFNPRDHSDLSSRAKLAKLQDQRVHDYFTTVTESWLLGDCDTTHHYDVAVKTLKECATPKHQMDLASELKLLIYMDRHPNIVNLLASCTIRGDLWVIMEYCDYGSLKTFLSDRRKLFTPTWSKNSAKMSSEICFFDLLQMTEQTVQGLMFLHCWKVVHRDISARNILVDANFTLKIADFGLARSENFVAPSDDILPIKWSSLESLLRHEYTTKSDIWSIAVLFWEIFSFGEVPYPGMSSKEVIQQLKEGYRMSAPNHCPEEIWSIITECWNADPDERPNAMELFEQLDEVKVSVCSAPDGQYYGASGGEYGHTGTVEGPSLDVILEGKEKMEKRSKAFPDVHKTATKDTVEKCGPSTISYDEYRKLENEIYRLRNEIQHLKENDERSQSIIEEMKTQNERFVNIKPNINKDIENSTEVSENIEASDIVDDTGTVDDSQAMVCMDTIELMNLPASDIEFDALDGSDTDIESGI